MKLVDDNCALQFYDDNKYQCHVCVEGAYFGYEWETYNCKFALTDCEGSDCGTNYYAVQDATGDACLPGYYGSPGHCTPCTANCLVCTTQMCEVCALGYFKHPSGDGTCYNYCPTGFVGFYSNDVCIGGNSPVAEFNFVQE